MKFFAIAANGQAQPLRQRIDAGNTDAVQTAGNLVGVLVEFAAGMQFGQRDFGRRALGSCLSSILIAGRNAAPVVGDADRVVGMNGDDDIVTMPGQASSIELSTTSNTRWCRPVPSEVSPMYMPGRLRTASSLRGSGCWIRRRQVSFLAGCFLRSLLVFHVKLN
jgi:hypothetical protein